MHLRRTGDHGKISLKEGKLIAAEGTALQMQTDLLILFRTKELQRKECEIFWIDVPIRVHACSPFLSVNNALRIRVFTVPSGSPVISAISECVSPSKNAISSVFR